MLILMTHPIHFNYVVITLQSTHMPSRGSLSPTQLYDLNIKCPFKSVLKTHSIMSMQTSERGLFAVLPGISRAFSKGKVLFLERAKPMLIKTDLTIMVIRCNTVKNTIVLTYLSIDMKGRLKIRLALGQKIIWPC